jgi:hypothetical protein
LQDDHELEDEIRGHVAKRVADLFCDWEFLAHRFLCSRLSAFSGPFSGSGMEALDSAGKNSARSSGKTRCDARAR